MNLKSKLFMAGSALLFSATMAFGAITADELAAQFQNDGYSYIQIKTGLTQIKVEAVKDGVRIENVYDIETGSVLKTSTENVGTMVTVDPGVEVRVLNRDFLKSGDDDNEGVDDNGMDDDSIDGIDDDSNDDNGNDDSGDDGDDDHGDDDHGGGNDDDDGDDD